MFPTCMHVIFGAQHQGSFNTVQPLFPFFSSNSNQSHVLARGPALTTLRKIGYTEEAKNGSLEELLQGKNPDLVITGTSFQQNAEEGPTIEQELTLWAKKQRVPTVAIADSWTNAGKRFSDYGTDNLAYEPDHVFAIDKACARDLRNAGIQPPNVHVTGNPQFDFYREFKPDQQLVARLIGLSSDKYIIGFVGDVQERNNNEQLGYNDLDIMETLVAAVKSYDDIVIAARRHPSETEEAWTNVMKIAEDAGVPIQDVTTSEERFYLGAADLVIAGRSTMLYKAALMGKPLLSVKQCIPEQDTFGPTKNRLLPAVYNRETAIKWIQKAKKEPCLGYDVDTLRGEGPALDRVVTQISELYPSLDINK